jgi:uncharacterized protein
MIPPRAPRAEARPELDEAGRVGSPKTPATYRRWFLGAKNRQIPSLSEEGELEMHTNEQLLRDLDQAQIRGDIEAFSEFLVDDVVAHFPGKSSLAGEYQGKDQLLDMFGRWQERTPEFTFDPHAYFADDEHGVCLQFSHYKRGNEQLDSNDVIVYHFRGGKVSEVWLMSYDEDAVDAFLG